MKLSDLSITELLTLESYLTKQKSKIHTILKKRYKERGINYGK